MVCPFCLQPCFQIILFVEPIFRVFYGFELHEKVAFVIEHYYLSTAMKVQNKGIFLSATASIFLLLLSLRLSANPPDTTSERKWEHYVELHAYVFNDGVIFLPIYEVDKGKLHLEARYNYEDSNTGSAWIGYNLSGGKKLKYRFTPMTGAVVGNTNGIAGALVSELEFKQVSLYSESEYVYDLNDAEGSFYYNWTDLAYSFTRRFWLGLSFQHTRVFESDREVQRGLFVGTAFRNLTFTGYLYNPAYDPFVIITVALDF